ncbi:MAG: hypothetical protein HYZ93_02685, partial [Candidatus Omnitrophica bacterium]|nr:hypothetical protein [Candidatus Omnitrophota bacterium]
MDRETPDKVCFSTFASAAAAPPFQVVRLGHGVGHGRPPCGPTVLLKMANARRPNGFALLATIFILVILSTMAAVMVQLYVGQSKGALEALDSAKTFALADGGMRWIFQNQFDGDTDFTNNASPTGAPFGGTPVTMGE